MEEGAEGDEENLWVLPCGDFDIDAEAVAEVGAVGGRREDFADDDDPLFFDAECGDFGKGSGFDARDAARERGGATPMFDGDGVADLDMGCVLGEDFGFDLEVGGVTDF